MARIVRVSRSELGAEACLPYCFLMASSGGLGLSDRGIQTEVVRGCGCSCSDPSIRPSWPFGFEVAAEFAYPGIVPLAAYSCISWSYYWCFDPGV